MTVVSYIDLNSPFVMRSKVSDFLPEVVVAPSDKQEFVYVNKDFSGYKSVKKPECKTFTSSVSDNLEALRCLGVRLKETFLEVGDVCFNNLVFLFASQISDKLCPDSDQLIVLHFATFKSILAVCELISETKQQHQPKLSDTDLVCIRLDEFLPLYSGCNSNGSKTFKSAAMQTVKTVISYDSKLCDNEVQCYQQWKSECNSNHKNDENETEAAVAAMVATDTRKKPPTRAAADGLDVHSILPDESGKRVRAQRQNVNVDRTLLHVDDESEDFLQTHNPSVKKVKYAKANSAAAAKGANSKSKAGLARGAPAARKPAPVTTAKVPLNTVLNIALQTRAAEKSVPHQPPVMTESPAIAQVQQAMQPVIAMVQVMAESFKEVISELRKTDSHKGDKDRDTDTEPPRRKTNKQHKESVQDERAPDPPAAEPPQQNNRDSGSKKGKKSAPPPAQNDPPSPDGSSSDNSGESYRHPRNSYRPSRHADERRIDERDRYEAQYRSSGRSHSSHYARDSGYRGGDQHTHYHTHEAYSDHRHRDEEEVYGLKELLSTVDNLTRRAHSSGRGRSGRW